MVNYSEYFQGHTFKTFTTRYHVILHNANYNLTSLARLDKWHNDSFFLALSTFPDHNKSTPANTNIFQESFVKPMEAYCIHLKKKNLLCFSELTS